MGHTAPDSWGIEVWCIEWRGEVRFKDILTSMFLLHLLSLSWNCTLWFKNMLLYVNCELPISETNWGKESGLETNVHT